MKTLAANWKMNLPPEGAIVWVEDVLRWPASTNLEIAVAPPFPYLEPISRAIDDLSLILAAQNVSEYESGAYTGEVAGSMLRDAGCGAVIIGHSERRRIFGEDDETIGRKLRAADKAGLRLILCIGETKELRDAGKTIEHLDTQLEAALGGAEAPTGLVIAYEPVWAIGTGDNATPDQVEEAHAAIGKIVADMGIEGVRILYGGSVNEKNAEELAAVPGVGGFLVGGASLSSRTFRAIRNALTG